MSHPQLLPWGPLERYALVHIRARGLDRVENGRHRHEGNGQDRTVTALSELLDMPRASVIRCRAGRPLTALIADRVAVKQLGIHPSLIWGDDWWGLPALAEPKWQEPVDQRRARRQDRAEFARVWATIDPAYMRGRHAEARAWSTALRTTWRTEQAAA